MHCAGEIKCCLYIHLTACVRACMRVYKKVRSDIAQYPVLGTIQSALHFTPWQTCSFQRHLDSLGGTQPCCNYCVKTIRSDVHLCL